MGQNIRTSLTQAVADELRSQPECIRLVMADTALTPYDFGTVGSRTTPAMAPQLRTMAATAREQLINTAAERWKVSKQNVALSDGFVIEKGSSRKVGIGEIAASIDWVQVIGREDCKTPVSDWQHSGKSLTKINGAEMVTGKHRYASDMKKPGMLYGRILRPPSLGAKLESLDTSAALQLPGVSCGARWRLDRSCGARRIGCEPGDSEAERQLAPVKQISSNELFGYLKANPAEEDPSRKVHPVGAAENATPASAEQQLASSYTDFLHRACTVRAAGGVSGVE